MEDQIEKLASDVKNGSPFTQRGVFLMPNNLMKIFHFGLLCNVATSHDVGSFTPLNVATLDLNVVTSVLALDPL